MKRWLARRRWRTAVGLASLLTCAPLAVATAQVVIAPDPAARFEWSGQVESNFVREFDTKTRGGDRFSSWQLALEGSYGGPINESILVGVRAGYRFADYAFVLDNAPGIPSTYGSNELPRDPWGAVNTFDIAPDTTVLIGDRFAFVAAVPIRWSAESGARRNAFSAGISGLLRWQINDAVAIGAGLGVTSQIEGGAETYPVVSLAWRITPSLDWRSEGSWIQGGRTTLFWGPSQAVRLTLSAGYERNRFRLDDNGNAPDQNGIGEITSVPIEVGLRFGLAEGVFLDFRAGIALAGQLRVEDDSGDELFEQDYDPSPRVGIALRLPLGRP